MMLGKWLVEQCAPTLGGMKTANLFNCPFTVETELYRHVAAWNKVLNSKGVSICILCKRENRALVYVCRDSMLSQDLRKEGVWEFLNQCGYDKPDLDGCIQKLKERLCSSGDFPHEIGLFLGCPLEDVKGFMENSGRNFKYSGYWKVYANESETIKLFHKYKKCSDLYKRLFENRSRSVVQLTVSVS